MSLLQRWPLEDGTFHILLIVLLGEHASQALALKTTQWMGKGKVVDISKREEGLPLLPQVPRIPMKQRVQPHTQGPPTRHGFA